MPVATLSPEFWTTNGISPEDLVAVHIAGAYSWRGDIATQHLDSTALEQLTTYGFNSLPVISPDRKRIAYRSIPRSFIATPESSWHDTGMIFNIKVISTDGNQVWQLTDNEQRRSMPIWSPDSQRVAFIEGPQSMLVEVTVDSQVRREIAQGAKDPRYRPDGTGIGYLTSDGGLAWNEGDVVHTLVATSTLPIYTTVHDFDWLPDGQHVVYTLADTTHQKDAFVPFGIEYNVWLTPVEHFAPAKIADDVHDLSVSPDGRSIAALRGTGYGDVCVIDWHQVFLLLAPDLKSTRLISAENLAALAPEERYSVFTDLHDLVWVNDHIAKTTIYTCVDTQDGGHHVKTRTYLVDLARQVMVQVGVESP